MYLRHRSESPPQRPASASAASASAGAATAAPALPESRVEPYEVPILIGSHPWSGREDRPRDRSPPRGPLREAPQGWSRLARGGKLRCDKDDADAGQAEPAARRTLNEVLGLPLSAAILTVAKEQDPYCLTAAVQAGLELPDGLRAMRGAYPREAPAWQLAGPNVTGATAAPSSLESTMRDMNAHRTAAAKLLAAVESAGSRTARAALQELRAHAGAAAALAAEPQSPRLFPAREPLKAKVPRGLAPPPPPRRPQPPEQALPTAEQLLAAASASTYVGCIAWNYGSARQALQRGRRLAPPVPDESVAAPQERDRQRVESAQSWTAWLQGSGHGGIRPEEVPGSSGLPPLSPSARKDSKAGGLALAPIQASPRGPDAGPSPGRPPGGPPRGPPEGDADGRPGSWLPASPRPAAASQPQGR